MENEAWEYREHVDVPGGGKTLTLASRGDEFVIRVDGQELMGTTQFGSEIALADLAFDRLDIASPRVLVGGLGMGFTLAAVLRRLAPTGMAGIAELVPEVVQWNRKHFGHFAGHPLRDPRVQVTVGDVFEVMRAPTERWHAILLDVDNGPHAFTSGSNDALYRSPGLQRAWNALEPGGILGVWSSHPYPFFTARLRDLGFETEVLTVDAPEETPDDDWYSHTLWMARRPH